MSTSDEITLSIVSLIHSKPVDENMPTSHFPTFYFVQHFKSSLKIG